MFPCSCTRTRKGLVESLPIIVILIGDVVPEPKTVPTSLTTSTIVGADVSSQ